MLAKKKKRIQKCIAHVNFMNGFSISNDACSIVRAVVRTGATGAFAPVNFWQRVLSTRPKKGFPMKSLKTAKIF